MLRCFVSCVCVTTLIVDGVKRDEDRSAVGHGLKRGARKLRGVQDGVVIRGERARRWPRRNQS